MNCEECGDEIAKPRTGQRFCPAPKLCRQRAYRRHLREHTHRCACGKTCRVRKPSQRRRGVKRAVLVECLHLAMQHVHGLAPWAWLRINGILEDERERLS